MSIDLDAHELRELAAELDATAEEELDATPTPAPPSSSQRVELVLDSGDRYELTLDARDRRAYALMADRYKLPPFTVTDGAVDVLRLELLTVFSAWHAARHRLGITGLDWPAFNAQLVELTVLTAAPEVEPHPLARGAG